ncbi:MAG: PTS sugar transporter subunit IIA [Elusimicrobiota bacterium]|jgi:PTS system nitrogen regulatory IIA component
MKLTVRDVMKLFKVSEKTVYHWIYEDELPASQVQGQYRMNRAELFEWASTRQIPVPTDLIQKKGPAASFQPTLSGALTLGGIFYDAAGDSQSTVLQEVVRLMPLPEGFHRDDLLRVLMAREALGSTGIGDGIAVPHVRNPIILPISQASITLCFLRTPVDFGALDGRPVYAVFTLVSHTVRAHLYLLSQLSFALRQPSFGVLIAQRAPAPQILEAVRQVEAGFHLPTTERPSH